MTLPKINLREPQVLVRSGLAVLLLANLAVAAFAFHLLGESPADLEAQLTADRNGFRAAQQRLNKSKALVQNMATSKDQGEKFLASYMTSRRKHTSAITGEINKLAQEAGMKAGNFNFSILEPIENSGDLYMLTITASFEGGYAQLVKLVNELDRSPRFLLIDQLQVAPQPKGDILSATAKLYTFVKEENDATGANDAKGDKGATE